MNDADAKPFPLLPPGAHAVRGYYDREEHWPAASLQRRRELIDRLKNAETKR